MLKGKDIRGSQTRAPENKRIVPRDTSFSHNTDLHFRDYNKQDYSDKGKTQTNGDISSIRDIFQYRGKLYTSQELTGATSSDSAHNTNPFLNSEGKPYTHKELQQVSAIRQSPGIQRLLNEIWGPSIKDRNGTAWASEGSRHLQTGATGSDSARNTDNNPFLNREGKSYTHKELQHTNPFLNSDGTPYTREELQQLPETLQNIKNYYRHHSDQAQVSSHEHSSGQQSMSSDVRHAFEVANKELATDVANQRKDYDKMKVARSRLEQAATNVHELVNWMTPKYTDRLALEGRVWDSNHLGAEPKHPDKSIYTQIYTSGKSKNILDGKLEALYENKHILTEEKLNLSFMTSDSIRLYYQILRPEIERIGDHTAMPDFLRYVKTIYREHELIEKHRVYLQNYADTYIKSIDKTSVEKTKGELAEVTAKHNEFLKQEIPEHPFFKVADMTDTYAYTRLDSKRRLFGGHTAHVIEAILKWQGSAKTAKDITPKLEEHPFDGRIGADLERIFPELGDEKQYKRGMIPLKRVEKAGYTTFERKGLKEALSKGPIIATFDNAFVAPEKERLRRHVILDRFLPGSLLREPAVVVVDGLRTPYKISVAKLKSIWPGEVFAPAEALQQNSGTTS